MKGDLVHLQRILGYEFHNPALLREAMTHRSFARERHLSYDNQRLEFLGDAVLQIILTQELFQRYPDYQEGRLTKIRSAMANQSSLALLAQKLELGDALLLGHGETELHGENRESTISDAMEALLGAILLDSSLDAVQKWLLPLVRETWPEPEKLLQELNPKGDLQEYCQQHFGKKPQYTVLSIEGPVHLPKITVSLTLDAKELTTASAGSRKQAEMAAAREVMDHLPDYFPESM